MRLRARRRILIFLARLLPLSDRSGLNPAGVYNLANVTPVEQVEEVPPLPAPSQASPVDLHTCAPKPVRECVSAVAAPVRLPMRHEAVPLKQPAVLSGMLCPDVRAAAGPQGATDSSGDPIDVAFYSRFWGLQSVSAAPPLPPLCPQGGLLRRHCRGTRVPALGEAGGSMWLW